jgi:hypothetical protein
MAKVKRWRTYAMPRTFTLARPACRLNPVIVALNQWIRGDDPDYPHRRRDGARWTELVVREVLAAPRQDIRRARERLPLGNEARLDDFAKVLPREKLAV